MENSVWRSRAKVVAISDMVILSISILAEMVIVFLLSTTAIRDHWKLRDLHLQVPLWTVLIVVPFIMACFGAQMFGAIKLMESSKPGTQPDDALKNARIWQTIAIIFFVITIFACILSVDIPLMAITILWRAAGITVVMEHIKGLEKVATFSIAGICTFPKKVAVAR